MLTLAQNSVTKTSSSLVGVWILENSDISLIKSTFILDLSLELEHLFPVQSQEFQIFGIWKGNFYFDVGYENCMFMKISENNYL